MTDPSAEISIDHIRALVDADDLDAADELIRERRRNYPSSLDWVSAAVEIAVRRGDLGAAEKIMAELPAGTPQNAELHYARALILKSQRKTSEARREIYAACRAEPMRAAPWAFLSRLEASRKHWGSAFMAAGRAVKFSPERHDLRVERLEAARRLAVLVGSDAGIDEARIDAFEADFAKLERAWRLEISGKSAEAETAFTEVINERPDFKTAQIGLMKAAYRQWSVSRVLSRVFRPSPGAWMRAVTIFAYFVLFLRIVVRALTRPVEDIQETGLLYVLSGAAIYFLLAPGTRFLESIFFLSPRGFAVARGRDRFGAILISTGFVGSMIAVVAATRSDRLEPLMASCLFGFAARWPARMVASGIRSAYVVGIVVTAIAVLAGGAFVFLERFGIANWRDPMIVAASIFLAVLSPLLSRLAGADSFRPL